MPAQAAHSPSPTSPGVHSLGIPASLQPWKLTQAHTRSGCKPTSRLHAALQALADSHAAAARRQWQLAIVGAAVTAVTSSAPHYISRALQRQLVLHSTPIVQHSTAQHGTTQHSTACRQYAQAHPHYRQCVSRAVRQSLVLQHSVSRPSASLCSLRDS